MAPSKNLKEENETARGVDSKKVSRKVADGNRGQTKGQQQQQQQQQ
jgi:hypothetical protein